MLEFEIERPFDEALASAKAKLRDDPLVRRWRWKYRVIFPLAAALIPLIRSVVVEDTAEAQLRWAAQVIGVAILVSFWVSSEYRSVEKWRTFLVGSLGPWPRTERFEIREEGFAVVTPFAHFFRPWSMLSSVQEHAGGMTLHWQLGDPTDLPSRCLTSEVKQALARAANLDLT